MGPGRYSAFMAIRSSSRVGLASRSKPCMPRDSNWNTASVWASANSRYTAASSSGKSSNAKFSWPLCRATIMSLAISRIVKVAKPKKSNFTRPMASTSSLSNWLTADSLPGCWYSGQKSVSLPGAISTPPACMPTLRVRPSSFWASASRVLTSSSFSSRSASSGSAFNAPSIVMWVPGLLGISLLMPSQKV